MSFSLSLMLLAWATQELADIVLLSQEQCGDEMSTHLS